MKRLQKHKVWEIREKINKLVQEHYSFREIAAIVGLNSHQLVQYHFRQYRKLTTKVVSAENKTQELKAN